MRYTITALAPSAPVLEEMRRQLLAAGAPVQDIQVRAAKAGRSQPQLAITTSDLEASQAWHAVLERAGGIPVTASEESSVHDAIR